MDIGIASCMPKCVENILIYIYENSSEVVWLWVSINTASFMEAKLLWIDFTPVSWQREKEAERKRRNVECWFIADNHIRI